MAHPLGADLWQHVFSFLDEHSDRRVRGAGPPGVSGCAGLGWWRLRFKLVLVQGWTSPQHNSITGSFSTPLACVTSSLHCVCCRLAVLDVCEAWTAAIDADAGLWLEAVVRAPPLPTNYMVDAHFAGGADMRATSAAALHQHQAQKQQVLATVSALSPRLRRLRLEGFEQQVGRGAPRSRFACRHLA